MTTKTEGWAAIHDDDLTAICGGGVVDTVKGFWTALGSGKSTGTGPSTPMEILDNPPRALETLSDWLGMAPSGRPGDIYTPAKANSDGSVTPGRFDPPPSPLQIPSG